MIIGVSGKSGSGKSSVARYIANKLKYYYLDIDELSKNIRSEYKDEIIELVDMDVIDNEEIDTKKLGNILFNDKELMKKYNLFIYSKQLTKINSYISKYKNLVIDSMFLPLMEEIFSQIDLNILVVIDENLRMERVIKRDNINEEYYKKRDRYSLDYSKFEFDFIVDNNIDYKEEVDSLLSKYI